MVPRVVEQHQVRLFLRTGMSLSAHVYMFIFKHNIVKVDYICRLADRHLARGNLKMVAGVAAIDGF